MLNPVEINTLSEMKGCGAFRNYIDYIRFPKFRNLEPNTRVDFDFPLTVFVGQNGCGKSSALHALYGAPKDKSTGNYWFETDLDPIDEQGEKRNCYIYAANGGGPKKEVLKTRILTPGKPERWDTSEAMAKYGMKSPGTRLANPIDKEVVYINFRTAQNAFEKAFHEERPPRQGIQDSLRRFTKSLKRVLEGNGPGRGWKNATHEPLVKLSEKELNEVSTIHGRVYLSAEIIKHRFFGMWGYSVILKNSFGRYSEAFAGSGESAVVLLVHEIFKAKPGALLLLDEPETSLHPGAQSKVQELLIKCCKEHKHQIVVCTHSPEMVKGLPESAIKIFNPTPDSKFRIIQNVKPTEAFYFIGKDNENLCIINVEDKLAELMVREVLQSLDVQVQNLFEIRSGPGGETVMKADSVHDFRNGLNYWYLFDGDALCLSPFISDPIDNLTAADVTTPAKGCTKMLRLLKDWLGSEPVFPANSNDQGRAKEKLDNIIDYARYANERFGAFPSFGADEAIWCDDMAAKVAEQTLSPAKATELLAKLKKQGPAKLRFKIFCDEIIKSSQSTMIEAIHRMFVAKWSQKKTKDFIAIKSFIEKARKSCQ